jgi:hypothetical protein
MIYFSLSLSWKVLFPHQDGKAALLDKIFLAGTYSLSELVLYYSMLSWLLGFGMG